jgi:Big-like domain-containing protein
MKGSISNPIALAFLLLLSILSCAQTYTVKQIATYPLIPYAINSHGHVAGGARFPGDPLNVMGFHWSPLTGVKSLSLARVPGGPAPCFPGFCSQASLLNDKDAMAVITAESGILNCFVWPKPPGAKWLPRGIYQFAGPATCLGLNNKETVIFTGVGDFRLPPGDFFFAPNSGICCVSPLPSGVHWASTNQNLNNNDTAIVLVDNPQTGTPAINYWTPTGGVGGSTGIHPTGPNTVAVRAFNDTGQILYERLDLPTPNLFLFDPPSGAQRTVNPLSPPVPPPVDVPRGLFLNNLGHIAGTQPWGSFIWTPATGTQNLNKLIPSNVVLAAVTGLNDAGQITAYAFVQPPLPGGVQNYRGYILSPRMKVSLTVLTSRTSPRQITLTATVNSKLGYMPKDGESITFKSGTTVLTHAPLMAGTASVPIWLAPGTYQLTAYYAGSENYAGAHSATITQVVK